MFGFPYAHQYVDPERGSGLDYACEDPEGPGIVRCSALVSATVDGGRTWSSVHEPIHLSFEKDGKYAHVIPHLWFLDAERGWLFGPNLLATNDGGRTWREEPSPAFLDSLVWRDGVMWATGRPCTSGGCGRYVYRRSADGAWKQHGPEFSDDARLIAMGGTIAFVHTPRRVSEQASFHLYFTKDSGATWTVRALPCPIGSIYNSLAVRNLQELWVACGEEGGILDMPTTFYHSTDRGLSWRLTGQTGAHYRDRPAIGNLEGGGHLGQVHVTANGRLFMTREKWGTISRTDNGRDWTVLLTDPDSGLDVDFLDDLHASAWSSSTLYKTMDGGDTWDSVATRPGY